LRPRSATPSPSSTRSPPRRARPSRRSRRSHARAPGAQPCAASPR
jgi:hypothetical protein